MCIFPPDVGVTGVLQSPAWSGFETAAVALKFPEAEKYIFTTITHVCLLDKMHINTMEVIK